GRPSGPRRRPSRVNTTFFASPEDARADGYRACKRCNPDRVVRDETALRMVRLACDAFDQSPDEPPTLDELANRVGTTAGHLHRVFKKLVGITPRQFGDARRMERLKTGLRSGQAVTHALYDAGFASSSRLYENANGHLGMTPASYGKGGLGARIGYAIVDCDLGRLLVAATARGVCRIDVADEDDSLVAALHAEFPSATAVQPDLGFRVWVDGALDRIGGGTPSSDLPLDIIGTAFQRQVWEALRTIPSGETRSYRDVAAVIGRPEAARAVAGACAQNPVPIAIPCHRVVRSDGGLGGYRLGTDRKALLLSREWKRRLQGDPASPE
ncbi:MAG: methylated-DNA--[protein]-cysteine S-methyltransferase, partial [Chloroflexi bacterium]|nr:methylated-DNA--[protein]-cysteine S-methyltransferase [Chloroflexota bacterium]